MNIQRRFDWVKILLVNHMHLYLYILIWESGFAAAPHYKTVLITFII